MRLINVPHRTVQLRAWNLAQNFLVGNKAIQLGVVHRINK
ncbi:Hypothetical protein Cul05146_2199 [Corynebacterium ulcerans]|nr:Hypothetical protein Cul05146_2199 [Corynebacterium ulcerans]